MKNLGSLTESIGIYKITNVENNKVYIGQSVNIKKRILSHHLYDFKNDNNCCYDTKFYQAMRKHGLEKFRVDIVELCEKDVLNEREIYWIEHCDSYINGYNSTTGGTALSEKLNSKETQAKKIETLSKTKALQDENHPRAKLSNEEVIQVRQRYIDGESCDDIYEDYKDKYVIGSFKRIIFGLSYKRVGNIPIKEERRHTNGKFTADQIRAIRKSRSDDGATYQKLATEYSVSLETISRIINLRTYKDIK